jgi:hypothetical protein
VQLPSFVDNGVGPALPGVVAVEALLAQVAVVVAGRGRGRSRGGCRRRAHRGRSRIRRCARRSWRPGRCPGARCPRHHHACASCRPAPSARRAGAGDRRSSSRRPSAARSSSSRHAHACSGRCSSSCARGHTPATARRRCRTDHARAARHRGAGCAAGVPVAGQVVRTQLVAHDEEYVLGAACHGQGSGAVSSQWTRANHATAPRPATPWRRGEVHDRGLSRARPVHAGQPPAAVRSGSRHTGDGTGG